MRICLRTRNCPACVKAVLYVLQYWQSLLQYGACASLDSKMRICANACGCSAAALRIPHAFITLKNKHEIIFCGCYACEPRMHDQIRVILRPNTVMISLSISLYPTKTINPLTAVTFLGVRLFHVVYTKINIKDIFWIINIGVAICFNN
jgi:hypothetical protein